MPLVTNIKIVTDAKGRMRMQVVLVPKEKSTADSRVKEQREVIARIEGRQKYFENKAKEITIEHLTRAVN